MLSCRAHSGLNVQLATILHGLASLGWDPAGWLDTLATSLRQQGELKESWLPEEVAMLAWSTAVCLIYRPLGDERKFSSHEDSHFSDK